ncbi:NADPH-dependent FMN reductase [Mangrovicella endophytica]|uniref:NADPH-dependent FMN reductase n=1 Tax=Mangrovicella endophytica TaxID=2066697 RepID=UPI000C9DFDA9|nr:NAD(P)H-dependent oxidoreductase [Mangrovicella endophytica]
MTPRILILPGSNRLASYNRRLAAEAARLVAATDAVATHLSLTDYPLPLYDADFEDEHGVPENATLLAQHLTAQDGLILVSPEYNTSIPPLVKNTIDWISRVRKVQGRPVQPFRGLVVALASASPGRLGGMRALAALRPVLMSLGAEVITPQCSLADAAHGFDEAGHLTDDHARAALEQMVERLIDHCRVLGRHE